MFPLPLDTHKDWPNLQHGFEQLPGCGAEALDTPAFYRWAGQQTWSGLLNAAGMALCFWSRSNMECALDTNAAAFCAKEHAATLHNQLPKSPGLHKQSYGDVTLTAACGQQVTFMGNF